MPKKNKRTAASDQSINLLALVGLVTLLFGQSLLFSTVSQGENYFPPTLWISLAGAALFVAAVLLGKRTSLGFAVDHRSLWIGAAVVLSILTAYTMYWFRQDGVQNYIPVMTFWVFSMLCLLAAFMPKLPTAKQLRAWAVAHRYELLAVGLVTLIAFILRFYRLGLTPMVVNGDEGLVGLNAMATEEARLANPFALWENFGGLYLQAINFALQQFGVSPFSLRLMAAVGGTLAIPAVYLFGRQVAGKRVALISSLFIATSHTHMHFSRTIAVAYIQGTWLIPLELFFFLRGLTLKKSWMVVVSAILLAVHFIVYLDSQIALATLVAFCVVAAGFMSRWMRERWSQVWAFLLSFGILILPEVTYAWRRPNQFFDRMNELGSFQSGWVATRVLETGHAMWQVLLDRVVHAFLSLVYYPAFDFYGSPYPILSLLTGGFFMLGLVWAIAKTRTPGILLANGYFWVGTLAVGLFAIPPSADSYRMLVVLPVTFVFVALGLDQILTALRLAWSNTRRAYAATAAVVIASIALFNMWVYFEDFAGRCLYGRDSAPARFASYLGNYLATLDRHVEGYLLSDDIFFYGSHSSVAFLSRQHPVFNVTDPIDTLRPEPYEAYIASPNRIAELRDWAELHPGGELTYRYDCGIPILLAYELK